MRMPIPNDWDGSETCSYTVRWPTGTLWRIILRGLLTDPSLRAFWDPNTGDVDQVLSDFEPISTFNIDNLECGDMNIPVGTILMTAAQIEPEGWKICNGSALFRADFPELFALIGTTYGPGDGSLTFNLPDLRGKVPAGHAPGDTDFDTIGETGGDKTHTLTTGEMPSHSHTQNSHNHTQDSHNHTQNSHNHTQNAHQHTVFGNLLSASGSVRRQPINSSGSDNSVTSSDVATNQAATATNQAATATNQAATATNQNTGGGGAHNNLQPYIVLNYIIRTGLPV